VNACEHHILKSKCSVNFKLHMWMYLAIPSHLRSTTSLNSGGVSEKSDGYRLPYQQRKKEQRKRRAAIVGKSDNGVFSGAPEPSRDLFIFRVTPNTQTNDIERHLRDHQIEYRELTCMSHENSMLKSFRLTVAKSTFHDLFDAS